MSPRKKPQTQRLPAATEDRFTPQQQRRLVQARITASFAGPLPPPEILVQYNEAVPGAADRIITMAEKQAAHRMSLESQVVAADIKRSNRGLICGVIVSLAFLAGAMALILAGHDTAGIAIASVDIIGLAGVFVYGSLNRRRERSDQRQDLLAE